MLASTVIDRVVKGFRARSNVDVLATAVDTTVTSISYSGIIDDAGWAPGTTIEIGSEMMMVLEVDTNNNVATVSRGFLSTAVSHNANDLIFINPRTVRSDVLDLFNDAFTDMFGEGDLFAVDAQTFTYDPTLIGYPLPVEVVEILRVDALKLDFAKYWEPVRDWLEIDNADPNEFANGKAIMLRTALPPGEFRVIFSKAFNPLTDESEDLEIDVGLRPYMLDLPFYYAMNRMMVDLERQRSQIESAQSHQRAQDVPPFLAIRTGEWYQARYADRLKAARSILMKEAKKDRMTGYGS